jgi:TetR/AcrR family transcriptional regulator, transcriptional repressor for nem operon
MSRNKTYRRRDVALRAMACFWTQGYYATSIEDLVHATGVSRHGLYADFADKRGLFVAAMRVYFEEIVTPAFARVESKTARINDIREYFETQITMAEQAGLPGPGCMVANTMVEVGPHDTQFAELVSSHLGRLTRGFKNALSNERLHRDSSATRDIDQLASFLTISTQGLWSVSRTAKQASVLRAYAKDLADTIEEKLL